MGNALSNHMLRKGLNRVHPMQQPKNIRSSRLANNNIADADKSAPLECRDENTTFKVEPLKESEIREVIWKNHLESNQNVFYSLRDCLKKLVDEADEDNDISFQEDKIDKDMFGEKESINDLQSRLMKMCGYDEVDDAESALRDWFKIGFPNGQQNRLQISTGSDKIKVNGRNQAVITEPLAGQEYFLVSSGNVSFLPSPPVTGKPPLGNFRRRKFTKSFKTY